MLTVFSEIFFAKNLPPTTAKLVQTTCPYYLLTLLENKYKITRKDPTATSMAFPSTARAIVVI